jgi:hypothetical protein
LKKIACLFLAIVLLCIEVPKANSGNAYIVSVDIQNTFFQASFSYPDTIQFRRPFNVSVTISIGFYNNSINTVNVTEVSVVLLEKNVNVSEFVWDVQHGFVGSDIPTYGWGSTPYNFSQPYWTVKKPDNGLTGNFEFAPITMNPYSSATYISHPEFNNPVEVKLFVEIWFRILGVNSRDPSLGHIVPWLNANIYTDQFETPIIKIPSNAPPFDFTPLLVIGAIGISAAALLIIYVKRRPKTSTKNI